MKPLGCCPQSSLYRGSLQEGAWQSVGQGRLGSQPLGVREAVPTWISSMVCTMKVSCRSSMAPSIQLLKGAARLAYSKYSWSMVSSSFSVR